MNDNINEEWRTIEEFPNYEITASGKIRHKERRIIRKTPVGKRGYPVVSLRKDGKECVRTVHILVARAFLPNLDNKSQVNHIDGNKLNSSVENLEWCTSRENLMHARRTGLHKSDGDKPVAQYTADGKYIASFKSISEASRQTGIARSSIGFVANQKPRYKRAGGYIWKWESKE